MAGLVTENPIAVLSFGHFTFVVANLSLDIAVLFWDSWSRLCKEDARHRKSMAYVSKSKRLNGRQIKIVRYGCGTL